MTRRIILVDIGNSLTLAGVLPSASLNNSYSARVTASNGVAPYTYAIVGGTLPPGVFLDAATGILAGLNLPTPGSFAFTIRATDLSGATIDRPFVIVVIAQPLLATGNAGDGTVGVAYSYTYTGDGGVPPYTWSISAGALPAGLSIDASTGELSGTPTAGGAASWTVRVSDTDGSQYDLLDSATFASAMLALTGDFPDCTIGTPYDEYITISGGDGSYSLSDGTGVASGTLPSGLALSIASGTHLRLSGTPTGSVTTSHFTASVDSGDGQTATSAQDVVSSVIAVLMHFDGVDGSIVLDDAAGNIWSFQGGSGSIAISTSVKKFGSGSLHLTGSSTAYATPHSSKFDLADNNFTLSCYVDNSTTSTGTYRGIILCDDTALTRGYLLFRDTTSGKVRFTCFVGSTSYPVEDPNVPNAIGFTLYAVVRDGGTLYLYRDGVAVASTPISGAINTVTYPMFLGALRNSGSASATGYNGYFDEIYLNNGRCRYPGGVTYSPPTSPFTD